MDAGGRRSNRGKQWTLRPQDLVVALKLVSLESDRPPYASLGEELHLSAFEAHAAARRLVAARLASEDPDEGIRIQKGALILFVLYGAPYAFPPVRTGITIGFPTAYGVAPLNEMMLFPDQISVPVWPHPEGDVRGQGLLPLYQKLPLAARADPVLYELLALFDALRIGQARERELAERHLRRLIKKQ